MSNEVLRHISSESNVKFLFGMLPEIFKTQTHISWSASLGAHGTAEESRTHSVDILFTCSRNSWSPTKLVCAIWLLYSIRDWK